MKSNSIFSFCRICLRGCCMHMGCYLSPDDLQEVSYTSIKGLIDKELVSIDTYDGNPFPNDMRVSKVYILRVRNVNSPICDTSIGGVCSQYSENGCTFPHKQKLKRVMKLNVKLRGDCEEGYTSKECAIEWYKYQGILEKLWNEYDGPQGLDYALGLVSKVHARMYTERRREMVMSKEGESECKLSPDDACTQGALGIIKDLPSSIKRSGTVVILETALEIAKSRGNKK